MNNEKISCLFIIVFLHPLIIGGHTIDTYDGFIFTTDLVKIDTKLKIRYVETPIL